MDSHDEELPIMRILELFVLRAIDELGDEDNAIMEKMAPILAESSGHTGAWHEIIARKMDLPETTETQIREKWERSLKLAIENETKLPPGDFAMLFVQNLLLENK